MKKELAQSTGGFFSHVHIFTSSYGLPYFTYDKRGIVDGIERQHINIYAVCDKCGKKVNIGMIHVDKNGKLYGHI